MTISVIVPVFNRELTIARCLQSIINQIVAVDEVIVVDDGSVDGTAEIIKSYQLDHPNIKLVEKRNGGVASARNAGIRVATGEWILFLDSDDVWVTKKFRILCNPCRSSRRSSFGTQTEPNNYTASLTVAAQCQRRLCRTKSSSIRTGP